MFCFAICYNDAGGHAVENGRHCGRRNGWKVSKLFDFASGQNSVFVVEVDSVLCESRQIGLFFFSECLRNLLLISTLYCVTEFGRICRVSFGTETEDQIIRVSFNTHAGHGDFYCFSTVDVLFYLNCTTEQ